ncbi:MAG TPA: hypothetical protein DHW63_04190, partial [Hyphomonadaceae bacterium]|nr:hypothetical protein [Hyphomonadaceae bacterium]
FGGEGDDLYIVDNAADFAFEGNVAWGTDLVQASVSYALGQNIDNLTLVGAALVGNGNLLANVIVGNANANTLFGMAGNDTLNGAAGADQMFGGLGDDLYIVDNSADFTFEAQSAWGIDTVQTNVDYQLGQNIDNLVLQAGAGALIGRGNLLANTLTGNESANTLFGFAGNDTLDGGAGLDQLYGREGDDAYIVDNVGDVVAEANAAWGTDTIFASVTYFLSPNIEHLTLTGAANINGNGNVLNNSLTGNAGANTLSGQLGNDTLDGGAGADSLFGGEGDDLYIVDNAGDVGFEASAAWGVDLVQASVSHTLGTNLDNLTLTGASAINATGNNLANTITGNSGANTLNGLGGADSLAGGAGNDALDGGAGDDAFVFAPGSGSDTVSGFVAGGVEDSINLSAYNGSGVTWTITQIGADTLFAFSNGDQITLTNVTAANLVQTDPFGYS